MATTTSETGTFGALLRQHRLAASLSQEVLGERAQLSVNAIAALERGRRSAPRPGTVVLLADALKLTPAERAALIGAAAGARQGGLAKPDGNTGILPVPLTSFIGRESELAEVRRLLGFARMLTLTGAGGIGKTRLAIEAGRSSPNVAFVDLAPYSDDRLVAVAVAAALGVHEQSRIPLLDLLTATIASRRLLILLDNCEHLIQACAALVNHLLRGCPDLSVLATSRESLRITGEVQWSVPPLSVPDPMLWFSAEAVARSEAVRLFVERANAALPGFALTEHTAPGVVEVCRRLEGIPLAIELAAAWVRVLGVEQITTRLDDHLRLLKGVTRSASPRHQTLRAAIDWSYELLTGPERRLFDRLSVFAGGLSLEAAEAVCGGDGVAEDEVVHVLAGLVNKSLVIADPGDYRVARYAILETLRQYGAERLTASGEAPAIQQRHAQFYVALAQATEPGLFGPEQLANITRLRLESSNLRVALQWALDSSNADVGLRLCAAVFKFWEVSGSVSEGRAWLARLLMQPSSTRTRARARALAAAVHLATLQGDVASAREYADESLAIARELGDGPAAAAALQHVGRLAVFRGEYTAARPVLEEAVRASRTAGSRFYEAVSLVNLGWLAYYQGDYSSARAWLDEALAAYRDLGQPSGLASGLAFLGLLATEQGDFQEAHARFLASLEERQSAGGWFDPAFLLGCWAGLAAAKGQPERALRLAGAADVLRQASGSRSADPYLTRVERRIVTAREVLGEAAAAAAWTAGRGMRVEQALADAFSVEDVPSSTGHARHHKLAAGGLTEREVEVLRWLRGGIPTGLSRRSWSSVSGRSRTTWLTSWVSSACPRVRRRLPLRCARAWLERGRCRRSFGLFLRRSWRMGHSAGVDEATQV